MNYEPKNLKEIELTDFDSLEELRSYANDWPNAKVWYLPRRLYPKFIRMVSQFQRKSTEVKNLEWDGITIKVI